jgi:hypothetical protein
MILARLRLGLGYVFSIGVTNNRHLCSQYVYSTERNCLNYTRQEKFAREKHTTLLDPSINYEKIKCFKSHCSIIFI